ncbi:hypothetical protein QTP88_009432 [Uroleucon formosanum]
METDTSANILQTKLPLPPPIFIKTDIVQFNLFCKSIKQLTQSDGFLCKSSVNGLKLNTYTTYSYRKTVKFLKEQKIDFHTYQLKDEKSYRVVIRHLHHSTPVDTIKEELNSKVYCSPSQKITTQDFAQLFISLGNNFIAGGDFNSKHPVWGCRSTSPRGKILHKTITDHKWSLLAPTGPTYWPTHTNRHPDILDFFIYSTPSNLPLAIYNITDISSDHTPVKLVIDGETNEIPTRSSLTSGQINWTHYKKYLSNNTKLGIPLKTAQDLEQAFATFVEMIQSAAKLSSRSSNNYSTTSNTILDKYPLPGHINVLLRQKRKARAKWQITGYPNDKRIFNSLTNKLKRQLQNLKNQSYDSYISNLNPTNVSLWKATKKFLRHIEPTPPIRRPITLKSLTMLKSPMVLPNTLLQFLN